jgi:hypothetical protein
LAIRSRPFPVPESLWKPFDLVLLDLRFDGLNVIELLSQTLRLLES